MREIENLPPISPGEGEVLSSDKEFRDECLDSLDREYSDFRWYVSDELLTYSHEWGTIWRADLRNTEQAQIGYITRVTYFRLSGGCLFPLFAVKKGLKPLSSFEISSQ
jgi:hypothetical protein